MSLAPALAVANGPSMAELRLVDVRDEAGKLCRRVTLERAWRLVECEAGTPHVVRGELRYVRLKHIDGATGNLSHVMTWQREAQQSSGAKTEYAHTRAAHHWREDV